MSPAVLDYVLSVAHLGEQALLVKMSPPLADPPGDDEPSTHHEQNTFGLPSGEPIARRLGKWFRKQGQAIASWLGRRKDKAKLPGKLPSMDKYTAGMAESMSPLVARYWQESGDRELKRLDLDPSRWSVTDKHIADMIDRASFNFCRSTNASTDLSTERARVKLSEELKAGLVDGKECVDMLTKRVRAIYHKLSVSHSKLIARTEASRAVNTAKIVAAFDSGVTMVKRIRLAANACPVCRRAKSKEPKGGWMLLEVIYDDGKGHPDYSQAIGAPLHPGCYCITVVEPAKRE